MCRVRWPPKVEEAKPTQAVLIVTLPAGAEPRRQSPPAAEITEAHAHRRGGAAARRGILSVPLTVDSNEAKSDNEDTTPLPFVPGPPVESSSIQPPFRPTATTGAAQGSLRGTLWLDVEPNSAQVYVDGFYLGTVEECHRNPAGLSLATGWHRLEFRAPGYETPAVNVTIETNRTTSYQGALRPTRP